MLVRALFAIATLACSVSACAGGASTAPPENELTFSIYGPGRFLYFAAHFDTHQLVAEERSGFRIRRTITPDEEARLRALITNEFLTACSADHTRRQEAAERCGLGDRADPWFDDAGAYIHAGHEELVADPHLTSPEGGPAADAGEDGDASESGVPPTQVLACTELAPTRTVAAVLPPENLWRPCFVGKRVLPETKAVMDALEAFALEVGGQR